jgi:glycosyltransferase involved in cell wall biosynthesis
MIVIASRSIDRARSPQQAARRAAPLDIRHIVIDDCHHPLRANGVFQVARMLTLEQIEAGDDARIILFRASNAAAADDVLDVRADLLPLAGLKLLGRVVRLAPQIVTTLLSGAGPRTIFHIHGARLPLLWSLSREFRRLGVPYAITVHGRYSHLYDRRGKPRRRAPLLYLKTIERPVLNASRFVQAVTASEKAIVQGIAPKARIEVIPNAVFSSARDGPPAAPRRSGPTQGFPRFGFCGRYAIEHKGLDLLVEGFALYRRAGGKGRLTLVGTGPEREQLIVMAARLGVKDLVEVNGPLFADEKNAILESWDFFVQPSRFDVLPGGLLGAALLGSPLIVTAETGLLQQVVSLEAGIPIGDLSAAAVAVALQTAENVGPDAWPRMSCNAHVMATSIGDWTAIAARIRSLYDLA